MRTGRRRSSTTARPAGWCRPTTRARCARRWSRSWTTRTSGGAAARLHMRLRASATRGRRWSSGWRAYTRRSARGPEVGSGGPEVRSARAPNVVGDDRLPHPPLGPRSPRPDQRLRRRRRGGGAAADGAAAGGAVRGGEAALDRAPAAADPRGRGGGGRAAGRRRFSALPRPLAAVARSCRARARALARGSPARRRAPRRGRLAGRRRGAGCPRVLVQAACADVGAAAPRGSLWAGGHPFYAAIHTRTAHAVGQLFLDGRDELQLATAARAARDPRLRRRARGRPSRGARPLAALLAPAGLALARLSRA